MRPVLAQHSLLREPYLQYYLITITIHNSESTCWFCYLCIIMLHKTGLSLVLIGKPFIIFKVNVITNPPFSNHVRYLTE